MEQLDQHRTRYNRLSTEMLDIIHSDSIQTRGRKSPFGYMQVIYFQFTIDQSLFHTSHRLLMLCYGEILTIP